MFDLTVDHPDHRFYTNGILSHNTISSAILILHTILFNNDKNAYMHVLEAKLSTNIHGYACIYWTVGIKYCFLVHDTVSEPCQYHILTKSDIAVSK